MKPEVSSSRLNALLIKVTVMGNVLVTKSFLSSWFIHENEKILRYKLLSALIFAVLTLSLCDFISHRSGSRSSMASQARSCLSAGASACTTW